MKKKIFAIIGCTLLLLIIALPTLVSKIIPRVGVDYKEFHIDVEKISLGWLGPQKLERIRGKSYDLGINLDVDSIEIDNGLLSFLTSFSLGKVTLEKPILYIQPRKDTVARAPAAEEDEEVEQTEENEPFALPLKQLLVHQGSIRVVNLDGSVTRIDQTDLDLQNTHEKIELSLDGETQDGENKGAFKLESSFDQKSPLNIAFIPLLPLHFSAKVADFPTKILDELSRVFGIGPLYLQELIGPSFNLGLDHEKTRYSIDFDSAHLKGEGVFEQQGEIFKALVPLSIDWDIPPEAINSLLINCNAQFLLDQKTHLHFSLLDLIGNPLEFKSSFRLNIDPTTLSFPENGSKLELEHFHIDSKVDLPTDQRSIAGIGQFRFNQTPFNLNVEATTQLEILNPVCIEDCLKGQWNIVFDKIPTELLELLLHSKNPLTKPFGPTSSLAFSITQKGNETLLGIKFKNQAINSPWIQFSLTRHHLNLKKPVEIEFKPLDTLQFTLQGKTYLLNLLEPVQLRIHQASIAKDIKYTSFNGELLGGKTALKDQPFEISRSRLKVEKKKRGGIDIALDAQLPFKDPSFIGPSINVAVQAHVGIKNKEIEIKPFILTAESNLLKVNAQLKMDSDYRITPLSSIVVKYTLDASVFNRIIQPATFDLNIFASNTSIDLKNLKNSYIKGVLKSTPLLVQESLDHVIELENLEAAFSGDFSKDEIEASLYATTGKSGLIDANLEITDLFFNGNFSLAESCYRGKISFEKFPALLLNPFLKNQPLYVLLGQQFNATLEGLLYCNQDPNGLMELHFNSDHLEVASHFKMDAKSIQIHSNPSEDNLISLHFSKKAAVLLSNDFESPLNGRIVLDYLKMPNFLSHPIELNELLDEIEGIGSIHMDAFAMHDVQVPALAGTFELPPNKPIALDIHQLTNKEHRLQLTLDRPIGPLDHWSDLDINAKFHGKHLPLLYIAKQAGLEKVLLDQIEPLFGNDAEIFAHIDLKDSQGPISLNVKAKNCELDGAFILEESFVKLEKSLSLNMNVTPAIGRHILGEIVPLLSSVVSANGTILLQIQPDDFLIPIKDWKGITFSQGSLKLGTLTLNVDEEIAEILNFLKFNAGREVQVWSTPIYFSVKSQMIKLERFDFLVANRFPLALWGKIDFPKDSVNLKVGLSSKTLEQVFDINHLPTDFILPLTLKGSLTDISLDKAKATARIAALIAESKGSAEGMLLGNLLGLFAGTFNEEPPPPPTTTPLPWAKEASVEVPVKQEPDAEKALSPYKPEIKKLLRNLSDGAKSLLKDVDR